MSPRRKGKPNKKPVSLYPLDPENALRGLLQVKPETKEKEMLENQSLIEAVNKWKAKVQQACDEWAEAERIILASHGEEGDPKVAAEKWAKFMKLIYGEELPEGYTLSGPQDMSR